jgi:MarR family 2-MHQ and catechol resistance regulon transcriptional repressor
MPTHYRGTAKEKRALNAYIKLMRAAGSVSSRLERNLAQFGLTAGQFGTLEVLHHLGPMKQKDLCRKLFFSEGNITFIVDNLEKRNLIRRAPCPRDRRAYLLHLTQKGQTLIRKVFPLQLQAIRREMDVLNGREQGKFGNFCKRIGLRDPNL